MQMHKNRSKSEREKNVADKYHLVDSSFVFGSRSGARRTVDRKIDSEADLNEKWQRENYVLMQFEI